MPRFRQAISDIYLPRSGTEFGAAEHCDPNNWQVFAKHSHEPFREDVNNCYWLERQVGGLLNAPLDYNVRDICKFAKLNFRSFESHVAGLIASEFTFVKYGDLSARSRCGGQGQVITSHRCCWIWLPVPALGICFWNPGQGKVITPHRNCRM